MSTNVEAVARSALKSRTVWPRVTRGMTATIMVAMAPAVSAYGRLHRHADVEDRESEQQEPDDQPSVADMQDEQQLFVPSCEARPAAETRGMDQGGNDERRAGHARKAAGQSDPQLRQDFLALDQNWLKLARSYELGERLGDFTKGSKPVPR